MTGMNYNAQKLLTFCDTGHWIFCCPWELSLMDPGIVSPFSHLQSPPSSPARMPSVQLQVTLTEFLLASPPYSSSDQPWGHTSLHFPPQLLLIVSNADSYRFFWKHVSWVFSDMHGNKGQIFIPQGDRGKYFSPHLPPFWCSILQSPIKCPVPSSCFHSSAAPLSIVCFPMQGLILFSFPNNSAQNIQPQDSCSLDSHLQKTETQPNI